MSAFKFETRPCPECGAEFEALAFWPEDSTCDDCARRRYNSMLTRLNEGRSYTIESIGGAMPTQAAGRLADGRPYYFRARHGSWTLEVGQHGDPVSYTEWRSPRTHNVVAGGDDPTHGDVDPEDVVAYIDRWVAS